MNQTLDVQELAIAIAVRNHNSTVLSPDFLKYSGVVPADWQLARPPIRTDATAQVSFRNGVNVIVQANKIIFSEPIRAKDPNQVNVAEIACKYVQALPHVDYWAVGINPRGHVVFSNGEDAAHKYILDTLLSPGPWQDFGKSPVKAAIHFVFTLDRGQLNLAVNEAVLRLPNQQKTPVAVFSANFNYDISGNNPNERLHSLCQTIENWQADLEIYKEVVNSRFLKQDGQAMDINQILSVIPRLNPL